VEADYTRVIETLTTEEGIKTCQENGCNLRELAQVFRGKPVDPEVYQAVSLGACRIVMKRVEKNDIMLLRGADELLDNLGAGSVFNELPIVKALDVCLQQTEAELPIELASYAPFLTGLRENMLTRFNYTSFTVHVELFFKKLEGLKGYTV